MLRLVVNRPYQDSNENMGCGVHLIFFFFERGVHLILMHVIVLFVKYPSYYFTVTVDLQLLGLTFSG